MRIERPLATLYAVLAAVLTTAISFGTEETSTNAYRLRHSSHYHKNPEEEAQWKREMWQQTRNTLMRESGSLSECCPTEEELTTPQAGTNRDGLYVELFKNVNITQTFYEYSCKKSVENKPCRYMDYRLYNSSKCVQLFSYAYALVKDHDSQGTESPHEWHKKKIAMVPANSGEKGWMLDHIKIRSGCSCQVATMFDKKNKKVLNRGKSNEKSNHHKDKMRFKRKNNEP